MRLMANSNVVVWRFVTLLHGIVFKVAVVSSGAEYDVVEHWDAENVARLGKPFGDVLVFWGRFEVAGRVIVGDDNCGRKVFDCFEEYFSRMNDRAIDDAHADDSDGLDLVCSVECENEEVFLALPVVACEGCVGV
jgi:hypothetical protein